MTRLVLFLVIAAGCGPTSPGNEDGETGDHDEDPFPASTLCRTEETSGRAPGDVVWTLVAQQSTCSEMAVDSRGALYRTRYHGDERLALDVDRLDCAAGGQTMWARTLHAPHDSELVAGFHAYGSMNASGVLAAAPLGSAGLGTGRVSPSGDSADVLEDESELVNLVDLATDEDDALWAVVLPDGSSADDLTRVVRRESGGRVTEVAKAEPDTRYLAPATQLLLLASYQSVAALRPDPANGWKEAWADQGLGAIRDVALLDDAAFVLADRAAIDDASGNWWVVVYDGGGRRVRDFPVGVALRNAQTCGLGPQMEPTRGGGLVIAFCVDNLSGTDPDETWPSQYVGLERYNLVGDLQWHLSIPAPDVEHSSIDVCDLDVAGDDSVLLTTFEDGNAPEQSKVVTSRFAL